jgi:hypothetical protein
LATCTGCFLTTFAHREDFGFALQISGAPAVVSQPLMIIDAVKRAARADIFPASNLAMAHPQFARLWLENTIVSKNYVPSSSSFS